MNDFIYSCNRSGETSWRERPYYGGEKKRANDRYSPKKYNPYYYEPLSEGRDSRYHY